MAVQGMAARVARAARLAPRVTLVLEAEAGFRMAKMLVPIARILLLQLLGIVTCFYYPGLLLRSRLVVGVCDSDASHFLSNIIISLFGYFLL